MGLWKNCLSRHQSLVPKRLGAVAVSHGCQGVGWWSLCPAPPECSPLTSFLLPSICYYGRLFWEWGDGIRVHDSQKPQDPDKLSKEDVLSFIQMHSA